MPLDITETASVVSESPGNSGAERERSFMFAKVGLDAAARLADAVETGRAPPSALRLWFTILAALPMDRQRLSRTQAQITRAAGLAPNTAAKAWEALISLGFVCRPEPCGNSVMWEVAADAVTRLPETERRAALRTQRGLGAPGGVARAAA